MTTLDLAPPAMPAPRRVSQGTAIEQSRAVAQVQAAVIVARQFPRDVQAAIRAMQEACSRPSLANQAFYAYSRGSKNVTGPTIKLLQELATTWGNVDFGMTELSIDHDTGESEMLAYAWDLETNTRYSQIVIVQHVRDKTVDGQKVAEPLSDRRDVYEANTSNTARRLREAIRRVLPAWFVEEAETRCRQTLENPGDGFTLAQRVAQVVRGFESAWGLERRQLETRVGKPTAEWTVWDVAQLNVTAASIKRGELAVDEAFPRRTTVAEVTGASTPASTQPKPAPVTEPEPTPVEQPAPEPAAFERPAPAAEGEPAVTRTQRDKLHGLLDTCQVTARKDKLDVLGKLVGHRLVTADDLTFNQADRVISLLMRLAGTDEPGRALDQVLAELADTDQSGGA